jgi:hypothetical protein
VDNGGRGEIREWRAELLIQIILRPSNKLQGIKATQRGGGGNIIPLVLLSVPAVCVRASLSLSVHFKRRPICMMIE